jgi:hypothetical protein
MQEDKKMRFMCMHKVDAKMEAGEPPSQKIIQEMGKFVGGHLKSGVFKDGAGLHRSAKRARVRFTGGTPSVERGPYDGGNELLASFALVSTTGIEQAIALGTELGKAAGNCEVEIGPVVEGWDLNGSPRPADAPHRFLLLVKATPASEAGAPQPADVRALLDRWSRESVLQSEASLRPSSTAKRYKVTSGTRHWVDGPFTESKELIAGFSILEVPSFGELRPLIEQYAAILGDNEVDCREVAV